MNRREVLVGTAAIVAVAALPVAASKAIAALPKAEMFYTTDEPWGCFVRGHVSQQRYAEAALKLLDQDPDVADNAEDWLWSEAALDADGEVAERVITADAEHSYMRLVRTDDPELGDVYNRCKADDPGAIPITVVMF